MPKSLQTVDDYIAARSKPVRATLESLRRLVRKTLPETTEGMKWGAPVFCGARGNPCIPSASQLVGLKQKFAPEA